MKLADTLAHVWSRDVSAGLLLMAAAFGAVMVANSAWFETYAGWQNGLGHWVNDGAMALFFLLVGLEIKRELIAGELRTWKQRILPGMAAFGGMVVPALVYIFFTQGTDAIYGWAIPTATDIAFALGVLALLGKRVPVSLKVFLTALAILDDLGAIGVIAVFYTEQIAWPFLLATLGLIMVLVDMNRLGVKRVEAYLAMGIPLWFCLYYSGLHATLAGVLLAVVVPLRGHVLEKMEHGLQPWVAFAILPVFGFLNAGVRIEGMSLSALWQPVSAGIVSGLVVGKQVGVGLGIWVATRLFKAPAPAGASVFQLYGIAALCGIGFTMSLFIGMLSEVEMESVRIGILVGSVLAAVIGFGVLVRGR